LRTKLRISFATLVAAVAATTLVAYAVPAGAADAAPRPLPAGAIGTTRDLAALLLPTPAVAVGHAQPENYPNGISRICSEIETSYCLSLGSDTVGAIGTIVGIAVQLITWWLTNRRRGGQGDTSDGQRGGKHRRRGLGDCLTVVDGGRVVYGKCGGNNALDTAATWILGLGAGGNALTFENLYWYNKGKDLYLTAAGFKQGANVYLSGLRNGKAQYVQDWWYPDL
jgi:hypothetical protein